MARQKTTHGVLAWSDEFGDLVPQPFIIDDVMEDRPVHRPALQIPSEMPLMDPEPPRDEPAPPRVIIIDL